MSANNTYNAFEVFINETPEYHKIYLEAAQKFEQLSSFDAKTKELAYIAVIAATRREGSIPFHVKKAKALGATREEIISAIFVGFPAVGNIVIYSLGLAIEAYDNLD